MWWRSKAAQERRYGVGSEGVKKSAGASMHSGSMLANSLLKKCRVALSNVPSDTIADNCVLQRRMEVADPRALRASTPSSFRSARNPAFSKRLITSPGTSRPLVLAFGAPV